MRRMCEVKNTLHWINLQIQTSKKKRVVSKLEDITSSFLSERKQRKTIDLKKKKNQGIV